MNRQLTRMMTRCVLHMPARLGLHGRFVPHIDAVRLPQTRGGDAYETPRCKIC